MVILDWTWTWRSPLGVFSWIGALVFICALLFYIVEAYPIVSAKELLISLILVLCIVTSIFGITKTAVKGYYIYPNGETIEEISKEYEPYGIEGLIVRVVKKGE